MGAVNVFTAAGRFTAPTVTPFGEVVGVERRNVVDALPIYGVSVFVDDTSATTGTGAGVAETGGELRLQSGTDTTGVASLVTKHRLIYAPGHVAEIGVGIRIPTLPTGSQVIRWGPFDAANGFGFGVDATGQFTFIRRAGVDTLTRVAAWTSTTPIDLSTGTIWHVAWTWYGYGTIEWAAMLPFDGVKTARRLHTVTPTGETSVVDPNLPITVEVSNGGTASNLSAYVGGRSLQMIGDRQAAGRKLAVIRQGIAVLAATSPPTPHICLRKATTFRGRANSVGVSLYSITVTSASDTTVARVLYGATVTGGAWTAPPNITAGESSCETNVTPTSITGGTQIELLISASGQGARRGTPTAVAVAVPLGVDDTVVVCLERLSGGGAATVVLEWTESW